MLDTDRPSVGRLELTVVVPTRNEAGNIALLVERLGAALAGIDAEILFVDDSDDETPARIADVAAAGPCPVRLLHRGPGDRAGGLGSAVLAGLQASTADWVTVMDGDLQHPPEIVPALLAAGKRDHADVVVASRYTGNGNAGGLGSFVREFVSDSATRLAKSLFPRRLAGCTDPMSGFFAVRRDGLDLGRLRPNGFKILLEILARTPALRVSEHPFVFSERHSGDSKASWREGALYLRRLVALRAAATAGNRPRLIRAIGFAAVGVSGIAVNSLALYLLIESGRLPLLVAATLATQCSTLWNFVLTDRLVYRGDKAVRPWVRLVAFAAVNNAVLLARLPILSLLVRSVGVPYLLANLMTLAAAFAVRFVLSDRYLFRGGTAMTIKPDDTIASDRSRRSSAGERLATDARRFGPVDLVIDIREDPAPAVRRTSAALPFRYSIHGILTIGSIVRLKELDYFATDVDGPVDIEIHAGCVGDGSARRRARVTQYAARPAVSYLEQLGRVGSDFHVDMTDNIQVTVGPMLVRSPHVLYTNVVEALLRFVLVSRGYMLLHSACLSLDGRGVMLSALTDTGKTGTVLRLLRENRSQFLSDDMTIIDATGTAFCYPKPLTISQHTLRAINAGDLTPREWRRLRVQSRLHSKEGRGIGARLGEMNLPIMTLNAVTQYVVPPPKYQVDRLVPCERTTSVKVEQLFVIERKAFGLSEIDPAGLLDELIANTDDAYGFPPFRYFAPALVVGGAAYEELRVQERAILAAAMAGVRTRRLATPDFSWADHIPRLVHQEHLATAGAAELTGAEGPTGSAAEDIPSIAPRPFPVMPAESA
jgi:dolichol-phosphate mannosyltransferase